MNETNIINTIVEKIIKYPDIKFKRKSESELEIFCHDKNGFNIFLQTNQRESTLHFGVFHWHFDNTEEETNEMLNLLVFGLTGIARLKEFSNNGKVYKWTLQIQDRNSNWFDNGTVRLFNINFWTRAEIKYLHNDLLPKEILFSYNDKEQSDMKKKLL